MARIVLPGLIDAHVHLREPGGEHKEDIASGTAAALAGGIVAVLDMPNNTPPVVDAAGLARKAARFRARARCDYGLFLGAGEGATVDGAAAAAGLKVYLTPTYGPLRLESLGALLSIFQRWPAPPPPLHGPSAAPPLRSGQGLRAGAPGKGSGLGGRPIAVHAEGLSMAIPIGLAQLTGKHVHICHVARAAEIRLVRMAKAQGAPVTCEVAPHHLFLSRADAGRLGSFGMMKPSLGEPEDVEALWENLDVVDLIASDHAPHTIEEKRGPSAPAGVPGVETTLPLLLDAVQEGRLTLERLVALLHAGPQRVYGVRAPAAAVEVDPEASWVVQGDALHYKCGWTPYEGRRLRGRVTRVDLRGVTVYQDGYVEAGPGFGRPLVEASPLA